MQMCNSIAKQNPSGAWRHSRRAAYLTVFLTCVHAVALTHVAAQPAPSPGQAPPAERPVCELFVPFNDLHVLLGGDTRRVFMSREEFEELKTQAEKDPGQQTPHRSVILSAAYDAELETGRAKLTGELQIEVAGT